MKVLDNHINLCYNTNAVLKTAGRIYPLTALPPAEEWVQTFDMFDKLFPASGGKELFAYFGFDINLLQEVNQIGKWKGPVK